jgi:hypothetical protein
LTFGNAIDFPAMPADNAESYKWVTNEAPNLLAGWESSKGGSPKYKAQKLRVMEGGLDREFASCRCCRPRRLVDIHTPIIGIVEGLEMMRDGEYAAEKLVYSLV